MRYFSTFSGAGGFELGINRAVPGAECVGFSEIDKYASQVLNYHFPNIKNYGDITQINSTDLPDFDMLVGGSPCQDLSIAGKRKGLDGARSGLFFHYVRILKEKQPRYFIWENVKGALSSNSGADFASVLNSFSEAGYSCTWQILNAKYFDVPQNRERVFVIGVRGEPLGEVFSFGEATGAINTGHEQSNTEVASTLRSRYGNGTGSHIKQLNNPTHSNNRVYGSDGVAPTLNTMQGGMRQPFIVAQRGRYKENPKLRIAGLPTTQMIEPNQEGISNTLSTVQKDNMVFIPEATSRGYIEATVGDSINLSMPHSATRRGRVGRGIAQTLDTGMQQYTLNITGRIRRLTPLECERLMGWLDNHTKYGKTEKGEVVEISDSQRYKMCGNGVVANVVEALIKNNKL